MSVHFCGGRVRRCCSSCQVGRCSCSSADRDRLNDDTGACRASHCCDNIDCMADSIVRVYYCQYRLLSSIFGVVLPVLVSSLVISVVLEVDASGHVSRASLFKIGAITYPLAQKSRMYRHMCVLQSPLELMKKHCQWYPVQSYRYTCLSSSS